MAIPSMSAELVDRNPNMDEDDWSRSATHWKCTLRYQRRSMVVYFSQGPAISGEPTARDVIGSLALDAMGFDNARSFEDWCGEYGYDTDSRKAERTYRTVGDQAKRLRRLLGGDYAAITRRCAEDY